MHRRTHSTIRLAACVALLLLAAADCNGDRPACPWPSQQTIVFVDQSASSEEDSTTQRIFRETMGELLDSGLRCKGDAVRGFLVHEMTRGKVGRVEIVNPVDPPNTLNVPAITRAKEMSKHRQQMDSLRGEGAARLTGLLTTNVDPEFRDHTDLLGTLEVISDELGKAGPADSVRVIYLSDMRESMPAPRRNFDRVRPASAPEAETWADADVAFLRGMSVDTTRFRHVEVRVLLGNLANNEGLPEIRRYWERLFRNAGIQKVHFN